MKAVPSRPSISREDALSAIPIRNPLVTEEWISDDIVRLRYPLPTGRFVAKVISLFGKKRSLAERFTKLDLDERGADVWKRIDGNRSVSDISSTFASDYQVDITDAEVAVSTFLRELGRRGIIAIS